MAQVILLLVMKLLWCTPGFPFDPTGGGNRSLRTMCEMLASQGHEVRCVGTLKTGGALGASSIRFLLDQYPGEWVTAKFVYRNVKYRFGIDDRAAEQLTNIQLREWKPDILLTIGGNPSDFVRMERAKEAGAKIVFGLRNGLYRDKHHFRLCDGITTPSQWMTDWYKRTLDLDSTPLPLPINMEDCVATYPPAYGGEPARRYCVTMVNPSHEKGEQLVRAIAEALPDVPFQIVQSRAQAGGSWPKNCRITGPFAHPREIFTNTKILLVPSLWEEPGGRVVCEAMLNRIPPIVSDHGALPEVLNRGGIVVATPRKLYDHSPVTLEEAAPWVFAIARLFDFRQEYEVACTAAFNAGQRYDSRTLTPTYCAYFERILAADPSARTTSPHPVADKKESA
jgi:glycosyltransferase involved in cell wall biosynthesis